MPDQKKTKELTLKQAIIDGVAVDLFLFFGSSLIMCNSISIVTFFAIIAHLTGSLYLICKCKGRVSYSGLEFIRGGTVLLLIIAFLMRYLISIVLGLLDINWY